MRLRTSEVGFGLCKRLFLNTGISRLYLCCWRESGEQFCGGFGML